MATDLRLLHSFVAVARCQNISRAALELRLAQPAGAADRSAGCAAISARVRGCAGSAKIAWTDYGTHEELRSHLALFLDAHNYARRLKALKGLTPYEAICRAWTAEPQRFSASRRYITPGPNTRVKFCWR